MAQPLPIPAAPAQTEPPSPDPLGALLSVAGRLDRTHALIIAEHSRELLCALIRSGCPVASAIRPGDKPECGAYQLVMVPEIIGSTDALIQQIRRALAATSRVVVRVVGHRQAAALGRRLRLLGFVNLQLHPVAGTVLLTGEYQRRA